MKERAAVRPISVWFELTIGMSVVVALSPLAESRMRVMMSYES